MKMMHRIWLKKIWLTDLEYERYLKCVRKFGKRGYVYFKTFEDASGHCHTVWYSVKRLKWDSVFDAKTMREITDINYDLEHF